MYPTPIGGPDDAVPGVTPPPPQGAGAHADRDRPPRERQPVDDRQDREAADEPVLRQRAADHERAPGGAEAAGEEGPRRTDPEPEGAVRRGEAAPRDRGRRDAPIDSVPAGGLGPRP